MAKSDNLLAILWMLRSRKRMTAVQIAEELEVDVRTVYRYIDALSASGAPIIAESGPNGGYGLLETFKETPLFFSKAERIALSHASLFAQQAGYPYSSALSSALAKVERHLSPEQLDNLHLHTAGLDVIDSFAGAEVFSVGEDSAADGDGLDHRANARPREMAATLKTIESAVADRRRLTIAHYRQLAALPVSRQVDPYGLVYWRENWYLVAFCHLRRDIRMFRCDKIASVEVADDLFARPPDFSARRYFLQTMVPKEAIREKITVRVQGTPYTIENMSRHWFLGNFVRERSENQIGLAVGIEHAAEYLPYLVLSYGSEMTILEPSELRDLVANLARRIAEAHERSI